jgi:hypothetical protein
MSNTKFQLVSETLKDVAGSIASGAAGGGILGAHFGIAAGLIIAILDLGKDLSPQDQKKLQIAVDQYIKQNQLNPKRDQAVIYQFAKDYTNKLGRRRFVKSIGKGAVLGAGGGAAGGAIGGAIIRSED